MYSSHNYKLQLLYVLILIILANAAEAQQSITPYKINEKIDVDAVFDEPVWAKSAIATNFVQTQPNPKAPASQKSEVRILYDNEAFYIAAKLLVKEGSPIYKELGQRDDKDLNAESFFVFFDTFNDDQNGFGFGVASSGVQYDAKYSPDKEDFQWDAVWESKTRIDEEGWYVEMKIPFFNLRFADSNNQSWGLNFLRNIRETREQAFWTYNDQNVEGFVNQWGSLTNIENIDPPLRLSFTPFLSTNLGKTTGSSLQNNFNAGMDVKYGINESFTLDMTLIPDFGGVRSDEQILNLGPFEQRFEENRAFFTEGTELFGKNMLFYSRRIGQRPSGYNHAKSQLLDNEVLSENPLRSKLLNATKVSGRTKSNVGLGFFNAITGKTHALITDTLSGNIREFETEALTNYNILVAEKALKNASTIHVINTNVTRAGNARDANVTGIGGQIRDKNNRFMVSSEASFSQIFTNNENNQKQNETGFKHFIELKEISGNLNYGIGNYIESEKYNPNDLGLLFAPNDFNQFLFVDYKRNDPTKLYRQAGVKMRAMRRGLYKPNVNTGYMVNSEGFIWLHNLSAFMGKVEFTPGMKDYFEPQQHDFETYFQRPKRLAGELGYSTDFAKKVAFEAKLGRGYGNGYLPLDEWKFSLQPRLRFSDKLRTLIEYEVERLNKNVGFAKIYNQETIMGVRDRETHVTEINTEYKFNENMNLTLFGRYIWDFVDYHSFHTLENDGHISSPISFSHLNEVPTNENFSGFNIDAIFRWRFAPGSDIFAVYKKQLTGSTSTISPDYFSDLNQLFESNHSDLFNLKVVYFIDYNQLNKKK